MNGIKIKNYIYLDFKMFTFFCKKPYFNKSLNEYCNDSTIKSIQNMIENNKKKYEIIFSNKYKENLIYSSPFYNLQKIIYNSNTNPNPNTKIPYILLFLSIPSIIYFYYRKETRY
jgi:hypothetical protein